jgi:SAM-dependent methyltransferase
MPTGSRENEDLRRRRAETFDEIAELYDRGRRECAPEVVDALFAHTGLLPERAKILEVGCGTGQATLPLARRGCEVVAVELGANLTRIARAKLAPYPRIVVEHAKFEDWLPRENNFDIVLAVTAWHWLDPEVRFAKAASVLRPGGFLAFTSGGHAFPSGFDPFFIEIQECYEAIGCARLKSPPPQPDEIPDSRDEIEMSGYFEDTIVCRFLEVQEFTADEYIAMMSTASDHRLMETAKREYLFREMRRRIAMRPDGRIRKHNLTILHVARKKS